jgi:hypothetical protein
MDSAKGARANEVSCHPRGPLGAEFTPLIGAWLSDDEGKAVQCFARDRFTITPGAYVMAEEVNRPAVSLAGSYKLVSSTRKVLDTGEVSDTFGKRPSGYIIYTPNGRMLVVIVSDIDRPTPDSGVAPTDEQAAKLFRTMQAYGCTYEFDGRALKHHIDMSWNQTWTGTTQIRDVQKDGDKLTYTTRHYPFPADGRMSVVTVVWQKVD